MSLVQPENNLNQSQIDNAESIIASMLGLESLQEAEHEDSGIILSTGRIVFNRPCSSVTSVQVDQHDSPAYQLQSPFVLQVDVNLSYGNPWGFGYQSCRYEVRYKSGWTSGTVPDPIKAAIVRQAELESLASSRRGIKSEKMGPVSRTYTTQNSLGEQGVMNLLRRWLPICI